MNESQFSVTDSDGSRVLVTVAGELDLAVKDDLRDVLTPLRGHVTVDLSAVTFIDSSAIGVLVGVHTRLASDGGTLVLRNPQDMPRRALEIVGLGDWIEA